MASEPARTGEMPKLEADHQEEQKRHAAETAAAEAVQDAVMETKAAAAPVPAIVPAAPAKPAETPKQTEAANAKTAANSSKQADKVIHKETAQGFAGVEVDPTPNQHYTVAGVISGKPTPETDASAAAKARKAAGIR